MPKSDNRFNKSRSSGSKSNYKTDRKGSDSKKSYGSDKPRFDKKERDGEGSKKRFDKPFKKREDSDKKPFRKKFDDNKGYGEKRRSFDSDKKPFRKRSDDDKGFGEKRRAFDGDKKPFRKRSDDDKGFGEKRRAFGKDKSFGDRKKFGDKDRKSFHKKHDDERDSRNYHDKDHGDKKPFFKKHDDERGSQKHHDKHDGKKHRKFKPHGKKQEPKNIDDFLPNPDGLTRLNKYLSNAGICSRREADDLIKAGAVSVNGKVITEMGFKVGPTDKISYGGETLRHQKKVYLMLNKPKDYITTTDDPQERRTVMQLIAGACKERVYPVGRLDRNTTGLLLFTNDGELTTKLMHPKFGIKKVYQVTLDKNLKGEDFQQLEEGVELEDGFIQPDALSYINGNKKELGIEIHSGRNRIVRRIFEHLGYEVVKLDRVVFAGLTKKDLPRAKWRFLTDKEVAFLKMIG